MFVKVASKVSFWGLGPYWISYTDDFPAEIDMNKLDEEEQERLKQALKNGKIYETDENGTPVDSNYSRAKAMNPIASMTDDPNAILSSIHPAIVHDAKRLVFQDDIEEIKEALGSFINADGLKAAIALEKKYKQRPDVLEVLEQRVQSLDPTVKSDQEIMDKFEKQWGLGSAAADAAVSEITEEEEETIEINMNVVHAQMMPDDDRDIDIDTVTIATEASEEQIEYDTAQVEQTKKMNEEKREAMLAKLKEIRSQMKGE